MDQPEHTPGVKRKKSHFGCLSCKSRKIKCDETKPICRRCQLQNLNCIYSDEWSQRRKKNLASTSSPESSSLPSPAGTHNSTTTTSPIDSTKIHLISDAFTSTEPLADIPINIEVRLMYYWTTITYKSFSATGDYFQVYLPGKAFKFRLLYDSIMLLSAAHNYHNEPSPELGSAIEIYKFRTIAGVRKEVEKTPPTSLPSEELAWSTFFLALFWLTCDTETEFTGLTHGWRPLFRGMADVFRKIVRSDSIPAVLEEVSIKLVFPSGDRYLPLLQAIYKDRKSTVEDLHTYEKTASQLSKYIERLTFNPEDKAIRYISYFILAEMPDPFIRQINDYDPVALTLLAIFFALLSSLPFWFLGVYSWKHHLRIKAKIPPEMHRFLDPNYLGLNPPVKELKKVVMP